MDSFFLLDLPDFLEDEPRSRFDFLPFFLEDLSLPDLRDDDFFVFDEG